MQWANFSASPSIDLSSAWVGWPPGERAPFGSRYPQAWVAAWYCELLTPSCCGVRFGNTPLLLGSGQFRTPCERTQRAKASAWSVFVDCESADARAFAEPPAKVDTGLPPNVAAGRARAAVAM